MPLRIAMVKPGLDSHYRGVMTVSRYLVSQGMEVIYLGNQLPEGAARAAVQEDVDVLGISSLSGNHRQVVPAVLAHLQALGAADLPVVLGGIVPDADRPALLAVGVRGVFGPGTPLATIAAEIRRIASEADRAEDATGAPL